MEDVKVIGVLTGHPSLEIHQRGNDFALYIPLSEDYITQFGEYTEFGPYVCDCIGVRSAKNGKWGIITLESEIVVPCDWSYVALPFTFKVEHLCGPYKDGMKDEYRKVSLEGHQNELFYGGDPFFGSERFDCEKHEDILEEWQKVDETELESNHYLDDFFQI